MKFETGGAGRWERIMDLITIVENFVAQIVAWWAEVVALIEGLLGL